MPIITEEKTLQIAEQLWATADNGDEPNVFAILDGSRDKRIERMLNASGLRYSCLYEGKLSYDLAIAAPYIVELKHDHPFSLELIQKAWGNSWGIFAIAPSATTMASVRRNCRKIAYVFDKKNKKFLFRYYDPRVFRVYLPTCNDIEAAKVFGGVTEYIVESETPENLHRFIRTNQGVIDSQNADSKELSYATNNLRAHQYNFLKIRDEQIQALSNKSLEKDYQAIKKQFINDFVENPAESVEANGKKVTLDTFLRACLKYAQKFKFEDYYSIYSFFHMSYTHGWEFWKQPENHWAIPILKSARAGEIKIEKLEKAFSSKLMDQLWS